MAGATQAKMKIWRASVNSIANELCGRVVLIGVVADKVSGLLRDAILIQNL